MSKIPILIPVLLALLMPAKLSVGVPVVDFHHNGVIREDDRYYAVYVWDDAVVVMTGGEVGVLAQRDSSTVSIIGGSVELFEVADSSTASLYRGNFDILHALGPNAYFHIYGYDFTLEKPSPDWRLTGLWADGTPFEMRLQRAEFYGDHYVLHEVPEPATVVLLASGILLLRKRRDLHRG